MKAMVLNRVVSLEETDRPLSLSHLPDPQPGPNEIQIRISVCGVCHTELDEIEGRTPPPRLPVVLGHEIVGEVSALGSHARKHKLGDRVGVGWIHCSCGGPRENVSPEFRATGRDANGGYAELTTVPENYAYPIPEVFSDEEAAPLLCAGSIGYRALRLCGLEDGDRLGLMGFGGSAHIVLQLARHMYPNSNVYVFARKETTRRFAMDLGATWAGSIEEKCPRNLRAIIDTTPAWAPIRYSMENLQPGGRLVINAIRKEDWDKEALLDISYPKHLWMEKEIKSVANITAKDIETFLSLASEVPIKAETKSYALEQANEALIALKRGEIRGSAILKVR